MSDIALQRLEVIADKLSETAEKMVLVMERVSTHTDRLDKHEEKLDDLVKWKNRGIGAWTVITAAFTVVTAIGWKHDAPTAAPPPAPFQDKSPQLPARTSP